MPGKRSRLLTPSVWACLIAFVWTATLGPSRAGAVHGPPHFSGSFFSQQAAFGFSKPIGMAVAPDGRMFFTDDAGIVKTKAAGIGGKTTDLFDLSDHVNAVQDRGLISVAVDKGYGMTNRSIYLAYTFEDRSVEELANDPSLSELPKTQRLVRVEVPLVMPTEPIVLELEDEEVIIGSYSSTPSRPGAPFSTTQACPQPSNLVSGDWSAANAADCIPSDSFEHTIDSVRVDPADGTLWVSVGDGGSGGSTLDQRAWRSQREESYSGKLLHIDTAGHGLPGHPFCFAETDLTKTCTKVYAKGFRNPFRFFLRPAPDGRPVVADAGWETREELDLVEPGKNYGWPCREGSVPTPTWSERPECAVPPTEGFSEPLYDYPQITDGAVIGGITYNGKVGGDSSIEYPAEYKGAIFFNDYGNLQVKYLRLNDAGTGVAAGYPKVFADELLAVDWASAPNGELMYVDIGFGPSGLAQVGQISFDPNNAAPTAVAMADKMFGPVPLTVHFDGSGSSDPDGDDLEYAWDFDGDEVTDSEEISPRKTFSSAGRAVVTLTVDDGNGHRDTTRIAVFPGDMGPPTPEFISGPTTYRDGEKIVLRGSASDPDDGDLAPGALTWDVRLDHAGTHIHPWGDVHGEDSIQFTTDTAHDAPSTYIVALTATDSHGLSATTTRTLTPLTSTVRIEGIPSGGPITYAGLNQATPYAKESTIGLVASLSAAPSFVQGGDLFTFERWLDGAPRIRDLVVPDHDVTLTAAYQGPPSLPIPASGADPSPGEPGDSAGPHVLFNPARGLINGRKARLWGIVRDPSGVRKVLVALRQLRKPRGRCLWWARGRGGFAEPRSCRRPLYMPARLKGRDTRARWTLPLGGHLPPGRYLIFFRSLDAAGNAAFGSGGRRAAHLRVRRGSSGEERVSGRSQHRDHHRAKS